jgi:hypothetical protein
LLTGTIPPLDQLYRLQVLDLSANQLSGVITPRLGRLLELQTLNLAQNQLSGQIPPHLGYLKKLTTLNLANNMLSGPIPSTINRLTSLESLYLENNFLQVDYGTTIDLSIWWCDLTGNNITCPFSPRLRGNCVPKQCPSSSPTAESPIAVPTSSPISSPLYYYQASNSVNDKMPGIIAGFVILSAAVLALLIGLIVACVRQRKNQIDYPEGLVAMNH